MTCATGSLGSPYRLPSIIRSFFSRDLIALKIACVLFVAALIAGHLLLPWQSAFVVSALLSIAMNLTYPMVALVRRQRLWMEVRISLGLIILSVLGLLLTPWALVVAIAFHGTWDLLKHWGHAGVRFEGWYCLGCFVVDWTWAAGLTWLLLAHG